MPQSHYDPHKHHRRSVRLKGYDYAQPGGYFVTICVRDRECVLGDVVGGDVRLTEYGGIARDFWPQVPVHFPCVSIDASVIMPNHVHAIIVIDEPSVGRGVVTTPLPTGIARPTLGQIVAYYKYQTTKGINQIRNSVGMPFWQRSFYDHIIRNDREMDTIRRYILQNPLRWELDRDHPDNVGPRQHARGSQRQLYVPLPAAELPPLVLIFNTA